MLDFLLVSDDVVGARMAGPGIRAWEMARVLAGRFDVALAVPEMSATAADEAFLKKASFEVFTHALNRPKDLLRRAAETRILVIQGYVLSKYPGLARRTGPLVADIYDPFVLENLFIHRRKIPTLSGRTAVHFRDLGVFNGLLRRADHFLVASDRQKDLVAGALLALGRIGPEEAEDGAGLERLLSVVPFGISEEPELPTSGAAGEEFKSLFPQIAARDILLLWGGVLSDWYDPKTLLLALARAREADSRLKLLFLSTSHPNPAVPVMEAAGEARRLAAGLGFPDDVVIFNDAWLEYDKRGPVFGRADIGVSIHRTHCETRFAFRTRMLDYVKHGLPIVATEGDVFADWIREKQLGRVVPSGDIEHLAQALAGLAGDAAERTAIRGRMAAFRGEFLWNRTVAPLVRYGETVLAGGIALPRRPTRGEIARACAAPGRTAAGLRAFGRRLPPRLRAWIRRIWKA